MIRKSFVISGSDQDKIKDLQSITGENSSEVMREALREKHVRMTTFCPTVVLGGKIYTTQLPDHPTDPNSQITPSPYPT